PPAVSPQGNEVELAQERLTLITKNLESIEQTVERYELVRLLILQRQVKEVSDSIVQSGLANMGTIREYQTMIIRFQFSVAYLNSVATASTETRINETLETVNTIAKSLGFDS